MFSVAKYNKIVTRPKENIELFFLYGPVIKELFIPDCVHQHTGVK